MHTTETYKRAFWNKIRNKHDETDVAILREALNLKGDPVLPEKNNKQFTEALSKDNLFRKLATFTRIPYSNARVEAVDSIAAADWVDEGIAFPDSNDSFIQHIFKVKKLAGLAKFKQDFIKDNALDLEAYTISHFARRFGRAEEKAFLLGNGQDTPWGLLHESQGAQVGVVSEDSKPTFDEVIKLFFALKPEYRNQAVWIMNDETLLHLRTLKDSSGNYLYFDAPKVLMGQPIMVSNHMSAASPGSKPILFGDLSYYWVVDSGGLSIKVLSELYIAEGMIGLAAYEQLDGKLIRPEAVKALQVGA